MYFVYTVAKMKIHNQDLKNLIPLKRSRSSNYKNRNIKKHEEVLTL